MIERLIVQTGAGDHAALLRRREAHTPFRLGWRHLARLDDIRRIREHLMDHARSTGADIVDGIARRLDEVT